MSTSPSPFDSMTLNASASGAACNRPKRPASFPEPDAGCATTGADEIQGAVVVHVADEQSVRSYHVGRGRFPCELGPGCDLFGIPVLFIDGESPDDSVGVERDQVELTVRVQISQGQRDEIAGRRSRTELKVTGLPVGVEVKGALSVKQRGIRIAVAVEIAPHERPQAVRVGKGARDAPRSVTVVLQRLRRTVCRTQHDVEIAVHFEIRGPGSEVVLYDARST